MHTGKPVTRVLKRVGWKVLPKWVLASGQSIESPSNLRASATHGFMAEHRRACSSWVKERFPGAFCSASHGSELPSIQLITTEVGVPLDPSTDNYQAFGIVGFTNSRLAWRSDEWPAIRMAYPSAFSDESDRALTIGCRRHDAIDPRFRAGRQEPESDWSIAQFADDFFQGLVLRWALTNLLVEHRRRIADLRDMLAKNARRRTTVRTLKQTRQLVKTEAFDSEVAAYEIRRFRGRRLVVSSGGHGNGRGAPRSSRRAAALTDQACRGHARAPESSLRTDFLKN